MFLATFMICIHSFDLRSSAPCPIINKNIRIQFLAVFKILWISCFNYFSDTLDRIDRHGACSTTYLFLISGTFFSTFIQPGPIESARWFVATIAFKFPFQTSIIESLLSTSCNAKFDSHFLTFVEIAIKNPIFLIIKDAVTI